MLVQRLKTPDDEIEKDKKIFIIEDEKAITFGECESKNPGKKCICLHFMENEFILRDADSLEEDLKKYRKEIRITEEQMVESLKKKKILIISDDAGCGKSTVTSSLVRHVKKNIYDSWVFRINLWKFSSHDGDFNFENSDGEDLFDEVFQMIGLENGFERWYFRKSLNQSNYFIFFDGYDEVPAKCKSRTLELISFLRRRTNVNIVITTRRHEQQELEERLNIYSHQLVPFNDAEQVKCLGNLLKWRLKYPFGERDPLSQKNKDEISLKIEKMIKVLEEEEEKSHLEQQDLIVAIKKLGLGGNLNSIRSRIDKLDLSKLVKNILMKTKLEERITEFMGIPLHLSMVGSIMYFDNFNVQIGAELFTLYNKFIDHKILIYVEEKEGHLKEGIEKDRMVDRVREDTFRIHIQLVNQVFVEGKDIKLNKEDAELCAALGIVSIHSGKALIIHQTFAEFFKAESIRTKIEKKVFIEMISEKKYEVVRRFISCALEKKRFENISEELCKDLGFLFECLNKICHLCSRFDPFKIDSDLICSIKIVKRVMKQLKLSDDSELIKKFIEQFNKFIKDQMDRCTKRRERWMEKGKKDEAVWIGCCLNVEIVKRLINRNFEYLSQFISGFVRFAENVEEVIDVLNEFISEESVSRGLFRRKWIKVFSSWKRENAGNGEERVLNRILELVRTEDSYNYGLICCAISNQRTEMFPRLLEYLKNVLGKEKFIAEIIESEEYKRQMNWSAMNIHTNINFKLIKEIHSKVGNETNILFDFDFKFNVILKAVQDNNELSNSFENVFQECSGIMNLKEVLLSGNSDGQYLVHEIMKKDTNENISKYLYIIKNILGEEMKQCLKFKNEYLKNIFHFAVLNKNEINFHFLNFYLSENEVKELLFGKENKLGRTCLHFAAKWNLGQLPLLLNYAFELLKSEKSSLEELLLMEDKRGNTFLHLVVYSFYTSIEEVKQIFNYFKSKLSDEIFNKLLRIRNEKGQTFLQIDGEYSEGFIFGCCKEILGTELFEELLRTESEGEM